jgi:hypothetical protein
MPLARPGWGTRSRRGASLIVTPPPARPGAPQARPCQVCWEARTLLGGNGVLLDFHVTRQLDDMEAIHTDEGTATIQPFVVGKEITGVGAFA